MLCAGLGPVTTRGRRVDVGGLQFAPWLGATVQNIKAPGQAHRVRVRVCVSQDLPPGSDKVSEHHPLESAATNGNRGKLKSRASSSTAVVDENIIASLCP